ncbi:MULTISPECIES: hypothetical protein [Stappiaceae]|jgi:hypothetical protein|nr:MULTISPECIES: hypothetical protein [Stappiaceae]
MMVSPVGGIIAGNRFGAPDQMSRVDVQGRVMRQAPVNGCGE